MTNDVCLSGRCNCGRISYAVRSRPIAVVACHCTNCRRQSGAAYSVNLVVPAHAVEVTGDLMRYGDRGDESGLAVVREFCGTCGSPIRSSPASTPSNVAIKAGTLDDAHLYPPAVHIWTCSALEWVDIPERAPRFEKGPLKA